MRVETPGFNFKGTSSLTQQVRVTRFPNIPRAELRGKSVVIPGRDGDQWLPENAYKAFDLVIECATRHISFMPDVSRWLTGSGNLVLSNDPDFCYRARCTAVYEYGKMMPGSQAHRFSVKFTCQPFRYETVPSKYTFPRPLWRGGNGPLVNPGSHHSRPIITIYGNGDITLTINGTPIVLIGVSGQVTINSEMLDAYNGTTLMNNNMQGDFPTLSPGENTITWAGSVSKIDIIPNWRWL